MEAHAGGPVSRSRSCPGFVRLSLCAASAELRCDRSQASVSLCAGAFRPSSPLSLVSAKILRTNLALTAENKYDPHDAPVSRARPPGGGNKPGRRGLSPIRDPGPCRSRDGGCFPSSLSPGPGVRRPQPEKPWQGVSASRSCWLYKTVPAAAGSLPPAACGGGPALPWMAGGKETASVSGRRAAAGSWLRSALSPSLQICCACDISANDHCPFSAPFSLNHRCPGQVRPPFVLFSHWAPSVSVRLSSRS